MPKIGELLVKDRQITDDQLNFCIEFKKTNPKDRLGLILRHHGFIDDLKLASALSRQIGWPLFNGEFIPDQEAIQKVGIEFLIQHQMFPLKNGPIPAFVISYIDNIEVTDLLRTEYGYQDIKFYIGLEKEVRQALDSINSREKRHALETKLEELKQGGRDAIAGFIDHLLHLAIILSASDIHIEPTDKITRVRFRVDGVLNAVCCHKPEVMTTIANYLLTKCNANTVDYKVQDGSFEFEYKELKKCVDVRFAQSPSIYGPVITLRLLNKEDTKPLGGLGYSSHHLNTIMKAIQRTEGIILVTGPTGSGKSTTLSSILNQLKSIEKKIWTAESPVERIIPLVNQLEINPLQGLTYATAIKSFLRQDPDIISIGEIRDPETAHETIMAANLGIQIFSTLHCNNPLSAITRLKDLGIDNFNIASFITAIVSQRLIRKLCPFCKKPVKTDKGDLEASQAKYLKENVQVVFGPWGCDRCKNGYLSRTVIAEILLVDEEIAALISKDALSEISTILKGRADYKTMMEDVRSLIYEGETSIEEAQRILG